VMMMRRNGGDQTLFCFVLLGWSIDL
jgi:hypothetical protein